MRESVTVEQIDAWLPQTQCTQCGYPRCRAYAEAITGGRADINQCPPGGDITIQALATLLRVPSKPLDPRYGLHRPRSFAVIDETLCIGCRKCIDACPVDAIVGARKWMHTVVTADCTGCELCLPPCPVNCIALIPVLNEDAQSASGSDHTNSPLPQSGRGDEGEGAHDDGPWPDYPLAQTRRWRDRAEKRLQRLARNKRPRRGKTGALASAPAAILPNDRENIRAEIRAAVERVKARKKQRAGPASSG